MNLEDARARKLDLARQILFALTVADYAALSLVESVMRRAAQQTHNF